MELVGSTSEVSDFLGIHGCNDVTFGWGGDFCVKDGS